MTGLQAVSGKTKGTSVSGSYSFFEAERFLKHFRVLKFRIIPLVGVYAMGDFKRGLQRNSVKGKWIIKCPLSAIVSSFSTFCRFVFTGG